MAFSDGGASFWAVDLTTRAGAMSGTRQAGIVCFLFTGLAILGMLLAGAQAGFSTPEGTSAIIGGTIEALVALIAGFRFRAGKGTWWGIVATLFLLIEIIVKIVTLNGIIGLAINIPMLIVMGNGVRAAWALKKVHGFDDDNMDFFS